jgi:toxin ParE1/3/4
LNKVIWSNPALGHLRSIRAYIEQFNPRAAQELAAALVEAGNNLEHFPHRGRPVPGTDKRELVTAYPYIIRYRIVGNTVRILRVRHTSRRPTNP